MARKRRGNDNQPIGVGMTAKQAKRRKPIGSELLLDIEPLTENQKDYLHLMQKVNIWLLMVLLELGNICVLYNALRDVLSEVTPFEKIYLVRSLVPTREIGFLPGSHEDKSSLYQIPYKIW